MAVSKDIQNTEQSFQQGIGLRLKLLFAGVLLIIILMGLVAKTIRNEVRQTLMEQMRVKGMALTEGFAYNAAEALASSDRLLIAELVDKAVKQEEGILQAVLVDNNEKIIVHSSFEREGKSYLIENGLLFFKNDKIEIKRFYLGDEECLDFAIPMALETKVEEEKIVFGTAHLVYSLRAIRQVDQAVVRMIVLVTLGCLILGVLIILLLTSRIIRLIQKFSQATKAISQGDLENRLELRSKDELGQLVWDFNHMAADLKAGRKQLLDKVQLQTEIKIGRQIQKSLIPETVPVLKGYSLGMLYQASEEAGSDYLDFIKLDKKHLAIVMADISGKNIFSSLMMIQIRSVLRSLASNYFSSAKTLTETNRQLYKDMRSNMFVTMSYMVLDSVKRIITFSRAGHEAAIIYRKKTNTCYLEKPAGIAIGIADTSAFGMVLAERKIKMEVDDIILLYSDGINEACNSDMELFGNKRLAETIVKYARFPAQTIVNAIVKAVDTFIGVQKQQDDRAIILIKFEEDKNRE